MTIFQHNPTLQADDLWRYSLTTYAKAGVKELCLALQDNWAYNVNLLLLCGWLQSKNLALKSDDIQRLLRAIVPSDLKIKSHRKKRRNFGKDSIAFKEALAVELEVEAQQQRILVLELTKMTLLMTDGSASSNLKQYCQLMPEDSHEDCLKLVKCFAGENDGDC